MAKPRLELTEQDVQRFERLANDGIKITNAAKEVGFNYRSLKDIVMRSPYLDRFYNAFNGWPLESGGARKTPEKIGMCRLSHDDLRRLPPKHIPSGPHVRAAAMAWRPECR